MEDHYQRIEQIRAQLDQLEAKADDVRAQLHQAIATALAGTPPRGAQNEIARRSGYSRETVAKILKAAKEQAGA